jgi:phosphomannomutase
MLYSVNCSKVVREEIAAAGGVPLPTRIGHAPAKNAMRAQGAIFGGEISGHYYHRDYNCCDSGELTAALMLSILSASDRPLSALLDPLLRYAKSPELNYKVKDVPAAMAAATRAFPGETSHQIDGYTGEYRDWWYNLRPSNTEPLLRLNIEADTPVLLDRRVRELGGIIQAFTP